MKNISFADLLTQYMKEADYKDDRLVKSINSKYGATFIHRSNIRNWREGVAKTARDWKQLAAVADTLNLTKAEADRLFIAAGLPSIEELWERYSQEESSKFLLPLVKSPSAQEPISRIIEHLPVSKPKWSIEAKKVAVKYGRVTAIIAGVLILIAFVSSQFLSEETTSICGESTALADTPIGERFAPSLGVTLFTKENTPVGILNNRVRALAATKTGVFVGYFNDEEESINGLSYYDRSGTPKTWINCSEAGILADKLVNSIKVDLSGRIWVATDGGGVLKFEDDHWVTFTSENSNLPSNATYGLTVDTKGQVWVGTWEGVSVYDGIDWEVKYDANDELISNHVHNIVFDTLGNIWVGHISDGISQFNNLSGNWIGHRASQNGPGGDQIRGIVVKPETESSLESIWFATADGGVSKYEQGEWTVYGTEEGLPSLNAQAIALDSFNRVWVGTEKGVVYYDGTNWIDYHDLNTLTIDFSPGCPDGSCSQDDHVWTGTNEFGLTHSRLPTLNPALDIVQICFESLDRELICPHFDEMQYPHVVTATYPTALFPGEMFSFSVEVSPRSGFELRQDRGDFLSFIGNEQSTLFGSYGNIPVKGTVTSGQHFIFNTRDRLFTAPSNLDGRDNVFISPWRVWMYTRYVGPEIRIMFMVRNKEE